MNNGLFFLYSMVWLQNKTNIFYYITNIYLCGISMKNLHIFSYTQLCEYTMVISETLYI